MNRILTDTDVILDFFFDRAPHAENSTKLLSLCEKGELKAYITPVILSNIYYLLRKTATHGKVIKKLKDLLSIVDVLQMDRKVVLNALDSSFTDFEDALQNYAAVRNGNIDIVVTRNLKDFKRSELTVMSPEIFLKTYALQDQ
jgi:predicted nucleic acid-binding protein